MLYLSESRLSVGWCTRFIESRITTSYLQGKHPMEAYNIYAMIPPHSVMKTHIIILPHKNYWVALHGTGNFFIQGWFIYFDVFTCLFVTQKPPHLFFRRHYKVCSNFKTLLKPTRLWNRCGWNERFYILFTVFLLYPRINSKLRLLFFPKEFYLHAMQQIIMTNELVYTSVVLQV